MMSAINEAWQPVDTSVEFIPLELNGSSHGIISHNPAGRIILIMNAFLGTQQVALTSVFEVSK
jgi:hypothetical protein